ncbi:MAG: hypothetical protein D6709_03105 [Chloroflexi bacterium]|nr:MAG: hypothetical protein D6709_03105 [Chloroflexota bacterium]
MKQAYLLISTIVVTLTGGVWAPAPSVLAQSGDVVTQRHSLSPPPPFTDEIIVKYRTPEKFRLLDADASAMAAQAAGQPVPPMHRLSDEAMQALSAQAGMALTHVREMSGEAHVLRLPEPMPYEAVALIAKQLEQLAEVEYASPSERMFIALTPNDPLYSQQWHYSAPAPGNYGANLPNAWNITTGSTSIVVAVVDTGILFGHPDLSGRTVSGYDFVSDVTKANDGDGRDANASDPGDWASADECYPGSPALSSSWHGTHVAGTIGAGTNNATGVAGINWVSKILPVRVLGKCGGTSSDIIDGVRWAAGLSVPGVPANANPARVINLSLGGISACSSAWQNAINQVVSNGAVVVVAAGNSNAPAGNFTPAGCANVITVAATQRNGSKAYYSNYGPAVEISAPGGETRSNTSDGVLSTLNNGATAPGAHSYKFYQGTSMAAPHVAGIASLMLSVKPALTPAQVLALLQSTATPFPSGSTCNTTNCGAGIVNAAAAVQAAQNSAPMTKRAYLPIARRQLASVGGIVNGNFEQGPNVGWTTSSNYTFCLICDQSDLPSIGPHGGNWAARFGGINNENASLKQTVTVPAGAPYLGFWHAISSSDWCNDAYDVARVKVNGAEVKKFQLCTPNNTTWTATSVNLSAYAGQTVMLELHVKTDSLIVSSWLVDDLAFQAGP